MLVLTRGPGEEIVIDGTIRVVVVAVKGDRVRLGIQAPESVRVDRQEVHARRANFTEDGGTPVAARTSRDGDHHP